MTAAEIARAWIVLGFLWYAAFWLWPHSGNLFGPADTWRSVPRWLRRVLRRDGEEVHLFGLLSQLWAISLVVVGVGLASNSFHPGALWLQAQLGAIALPLVLSGAVFLRRRSRSSGR